MAGLSLIALVVGYLVLTIVLILRIPFISVKALVFVVALLLPFADDLYYRNELTRLCAASSGLQIFERVSRKAGLVDTEEPMVGWLEMRPLAFVEGESRSRGKKFRLQIEANGATKRTEIEGFTSPYQISRHRTEGGAITKTELTIVNRDNRKVLGRLINFNYYGGWFKREILGHIADSGPTLIADCKIQETSKGKTELVNRVFSDN